MFDLATLGLPRVDLLAGPTPVEQIGSDQWIKREDLAGRGFGGSSVRKLEWLLGRVQVNGGDVLTVGLAGSHHLLATAFYGRARSIRVHAVVGPHVDTPAVRERLRALHAYAERVWPAPDLAHGVVTLGAAWASLRVLGGYPPAIVPPGGSDIAGCVGWIDGGLEIARQVAAGELPEPSEVWLAVGTGGTAAGLRIGLALGGLRSDVVGVVGSRWGRPAVDALTRRAIAALRRMGLPDVRPAPLRIVATDEPLDSASDPARACFAATGRGLYLPTMNGWSLTPLLREALDDVPASLAGLLR